MGEMIQNQTATKLLCYEAYYNYIHSMYVSSEQDAAILAVIFMRMLNDSLKIKDWIQFFKSERKNLRIFVPLKHLFNKTVLDWVKIISNEWERSSSQLGSLNQFKLQIKFLSHCWTFSNYGSAFFSAAIPKNNHVHICVNYQGVHFLNKLTRELDFFYPYQDIIWKVHYSPDSIEFFSKKAKQSVLVYTKQNNLINQLISLGTRYSLTITSFLFLEITIDALFIALRHL
ncbi:krev interaction trapped 1 isoform X2 [Brachionus plicatilis]|uniref:Krev interaction trapped 1 isoform X2 n=1 Tax=Brachionus plicatilis TaxID=10195 RepID=A0A3M7PEZ8_BRAPC|nr:krev interaction trapped 1 isoform X2 [Brachionus plicatilis]